MAALNSKVGSAYGGSVTPTKVYAGSERIARVYAGNSQIIDGTAEAALASADIPTQTLWAPNATDTAYSSAGSTSSYGDLVWGDFPFLVPNTMVFNTDYGTQTDPTSSRKVFWVSSLSGKTWVTPWPRAEFRSPFNIKSAHRGNTIDEYWIGAEYYYLSSNPMSNGKWNTLFGPFWGPPYNGSSPCGFQAQYSSATQKRTFRMNDDASLLDESTTEWPYDTWVQIIGHYKLAYRGWLEMWMNVGPGPNSWRQIKFADGATLKPWSTIQPGCNDAWAVGASDTAQQAGFGCYGEDAGKVLWGDMKIGTGTPSSVALSAYGTWNGTLPGYTSP